MKKRYWKKWGSLASSGNVSSSSATCWVFLSKKQDGLLMAKVQMEKQKHVKEERVLWTFIHSFIHLQKWAKQDLTFVSCYFRISFFLFFLSFFLLAQFSRSVKNKKKKKKVCCSSALLFLVLLFIYCVSTLLPQPLFPRLTVSLTCVPPPRPLLF